MGLPEGRVKRTPWWMKGLIQSTYRQAHSIEKIEEILKKGGQVPNNKKGTGGTEGGLGGKNSWDEAPG